jgi:glycerol-1-phosphatase
MRAATPLPRLWTAEEAFDRYESLRAHLPLASFPEAPIEAESLADVAHLYDAFILDAFGVLNVGETAIPGAIDRVAWLRSLGKRLIVLTNGASLAQAASLAKYRRMGFDFAPEEVVASRDIAAAALAGFPEARLWAAITAPGATFEDIPADVRPLAADASLLDRADGFLFLGSEGWTAARQSSLTAALRARPRPLIVANPDVVAPREGGLTLEPGHFAQEIAAATGIAPAFYGKPYANAFDAALTFIGSSVPRHRIAMVGDTLHTDVLGGRAAGLGTILIARHGLFRGLDPWPFIERSGIVPDCVVQTF